MQNNIIFFDDIKLTMDGVGDVLQIMRTFFNDAKKKKKKSLNDFVNLRPRGSTHPNAERRKQLLNLLQTSHSSVIENDDKNKQ